MDFPIVEKLGGQEKASEVLLRRCGKVRGKDAIRMWDYRTMPGYAQTAFMAECEQLKIPFSSDGFKVQAYALKAAATMSLSQFKSGEKICVLDHDCGGMNQ